MATCLAIVAIGLYLPFSPLAHMLGFTPLPAAFFGFLAVATLTYLLLVEVAKRLLLRKATAKNAVKHGEALAVAA
jgi:P-type Mg2+ transporter